jgi:hypothetical protein
MLSRSRKMMMKRRELYEQHDMVICRIMYLHTKKDTHEWLCLRAKTFKHVFSSFKKWLLHCGRFWGHSSRHQGSKRARNSFRANTLSLHSKKKKKKRRVSLTQPGPKRERKKRESRIRLKQPKNKKWTGADSSKVNSTTVSPVDEPQNRLALTSQTLHILVFVMIRVSVLLLHYETFDLY